MPTQMFYDMEAAGRAAQNRRRKQPLPPPSQPLIGATIPRALESMGTYLKQYNARIELVALGPTQEALLPTDPRKGKGMMNYTLDEVEFAYRTPDPRTEEVLRDAVENAKRETGVDLGGQWLERRYRGVDERTQKKMIKKAEEILGDERRLLFKSGGLAVYG